MRAVRSARAAGGLDPRVGGARDAGPPQRQPERRGILRRMARRRERGAGACGAAEPAEPETGQARRDEPGDTNGQEPEPGEPVLRAAAQPSRRPAQARATCAPSRPTRSSRSTGRSTSSTAPSTPARRGHRALARHAARQRADVGGVGRRGRADGRLGALLVPVHGRPLGPARAGPGPRPGPGAGRARPRRRAPGTSRPTPSGRLSPLGAGPRTGRARRRRRSAAKSGGEELGLAPILVQAR